MPRKRGDQKRLLKLMLHIFCEEAKTEPNYLNGYLDKYYPVNRRHSLKKKELITMKKVTHLYLR